MASSGARRERSVAMDWMTAGSVVLLVRGDSGSVMVADGGGACGGTIMRGKSS